MRPEEVARAANGDGQITSMRCTILHREHDGQPFNSEVWWVSYADQSLCVEDATGKIIGVSSTTIPTTGVDPHPQPVENQ